MTMGRTSYIPVYRKIVGSFKFTDWLEHVAYDRKARKPRKIWYALECGHIETRSIAVNPTTSIKCEWCRCGVRTKGSISTIRTNRRLSMVDVKQTPNNFRKWVIDYVRELGC